MKVIIAGSRDISDKSVLEGAIKSSGFEITKIITGGSKGVDYLAVSWAYANNIPVDVFRANWKSFGKAAGPLRNEEMAQNGDALIAVWNGKSPGTKNMINKAKIHNLKIFIWNTLEA